MTIVTFGSSTLRLARDLLSAKLGGGVGAFISMLRLARDLLSAKLVNVDCVFSPTLRLARDLLSAKLWIWRRSAA